MAPTTEIYALVDPVEGRARYVGQSKRPIVRYEEHLKEGERHAGFA